MNASPRPESSVSSQAKPRHLRAKSGSTACSMSQAPTGSLFPSKAVSVGSAIRPCSRLPALASTGSNALPWGVLQAGARLGEFLAADRRPGVAACAAPWKMPGNCRDDLRKVRRFAPIPSTSRPPFLRPARFSRSSEMLHPPVDRRGCNPRSRGWPGRDSRVERRGRSRAPRLARARRPPG